MHPTPVTFDAAFVRKLRAELDRLSLEIRQYVAGGAMMPDQTFVHTAGVGPGGQTLDATGALDVLPGRSPAGMGLRRRAVALSRSMGKQVGRVVELVVGLSDDLDAIISLMERTGELNELSVQQFLTEFAETVTQYELLRTGQNGTKPPAEPPS
jgi:hypothetical protein